MWHPCTDDQHDYHAACAASTTLTSADAQKVIDGLCGSGQRLEPIQVISAFRTPKLRYDPIRKVFFPQEAAQSLHGTAQVSTPFSSSLSLCYVICKTAIHLICRLEGV